MTEPLRLDQALACPPDHAFRTWADRFGQWWPPSHTVSGDPAAIVLEPGVGGRIYERTADGTEVDWGRITDWDPPHGLAYRWHLRRDAADATDVAIRFLPDGDGTRMEITHTGWERLGAEADTWRDANRGGWSGLLPHFETACNRSHDEETRDG